MGRVKGAGLKGAGLKVRRLKQNKILVFKEAILNKTNEK